MVVSRYLACLLVGSTFCAFAAATDSASESPRASRQWTPREESRERFRDIVDFNIFMSDRAGISARVEREREPVVETPDDPPPRLIESPPPDPDATRVLIGIAISGQSARVFIEDRATGEVDEITELGDYSAGQITAFHPAHIVYEVDGEPRTIRMGQTLLGETPAPPADTPSSSATIGAVEGNEGDDETPAADGGSGPTEPLSDREAALQRLREAREAERRNGE